MSQLYVNNNSFIDSLMALERAILQLTSEGITVHEIVLLHSRYASIRVIASPACARRIATGEADYHIEGGGDFDIEVMRYGSFKLEGCFVGWVETTTGERKQADRWLEEIKHANS